MTVRVFADYHHDCLYESLAALFEDRLGWELYRPTGLGWAEAGLWQYSENPAVQRQFLGEWPGQRLVGDHYEANEVHHPSRVHKLVTLDQFRAMRWDWLLASVTQHERLWHELADSIGAQSILQVGNVGQPVDWGLSHKVLAAANIAIPDRRGVIYHPEFSLREYAPAPITEPRRIVNLMNCLPDAGPAYDDWRRLQELLPDFEFREFGILGRDGIVGPSAAVAREMQGAGWAFHNKPQGDGYGFVIHQWAAVGRPLIGRASYYRDKLAAPLWGVSIDLDAGIEAAADEIRRVTDRGWVHDDWCEAMRETFRDRVDFAAEADVIREYLR